jgi:hypothetical protein
MAASPAVTDMQNAFTGALEQALAREQWIPQMRKLLATWEGAERKGKERREKGSSRAQIMMRMEEVAENIASGLYDIPYALTSVHQNLGNLAFFELLDSIGPGQELLEMHNVWVISQVREDEPTTYERWGKVVAGLPYPIMPLGIKSSRVRDYNRKLLAWAQEQRTAGAGPTPAGKMKPEDFLFFKNAAGGTGPYLPVETDVEGRAVVNGANIKVVLDEHQRMQEEAVAAIQDLRARLAESERVAAMRATQQGQQQIQQQQQQPSAMQQPQQYPVMAQQAVQQQYPAPQQQQYQAPQQQYPVEQQYQQPQYQQPQLAPYGGYLPMPAPYMQPGMVAYPPYAQYGQHHRGPPRGGQRAAPAAPANQRTVCDRCGGTGHFARNCRAAAPRGGEGENP